MRAESQAAAHFQDQGDRESGCLPHLLLLLIRLPDHSLCGKFNRFLTNLGFCPFDAPDESGREAHQLGENSL
jgi:hypothetical protein